MKPERIAADSCATQRNYQKKFVGALHNVHGSRVVASRRNRVSSNAIDLLMSVK